MTHKRLLVVDDEPSVLLAVSAILRGAGGYDITTARSGAEALRRTAETLPDLIVSDVRMPGMDGFAFAERLRSAPRTELIPIVFLTAKGETEDRVKGFCSGVDVYLTKPFEPDELVAVIGNILKRVERTHAGIARIVSASDAKVTEEVFIRDEELTEAEWRTAEAVARGLSNKEIAAEHDISIRTVENHISNILAKKRFSNRVEIARHVLDNRAAS